MDTEQLRMILDTLATMGAEGKSAFVWWLVIDNATPVVVVSIIAATVAYVARLVHKANNDSQSMLELGDLLGISLYGNRAALMSTIRAAVAAQRNRV